jgi:MFS family permease
VWPPVGAALALVGFIMASLLGSTHAYLYLAMIASFFIGAGMGAIFPTSTLAVQNAVESHEIGAASSIVIFVRQLGGAIGLAIYGAIFNAQLEGRIDEKLIQTPRNIKQLESPLREEALEVFAHAVTTVFRMAIPVLIVTVILSCLIPGRQLKGRAEVISP